MSLKTGCDRKFMPIYVLSDQEWRFEGVICCAGLMFVFSGSNAVPGWPGEGKERLTHG